MLRRAAGWRHTAGVHISAKADYAVRALLILATSDDGRTTVDQLVRAGNLPRKFLESIMSELRRAGLVTSRRGPDGGFALARPASKITVADILRAVDGPLAEVRGLRPESTSYSGSAEHLGAVWVAVRASLRAVLEHVTLDDLTTGRLPSVIIDLTGDPDAWVAH